MIYFCKDCHYLYSIQALIIKNKRLGKEGLVEDHVESRYSPCNYLTGVIQHTLSNKLHEFVIGSFYFFAL